MARHGQLALFRTYGDAKTEPSKVPATNDNLFLLFSQTKVLTSSAVWTLVEEGKLSFMDKIADHLPEFAARGKADITLQQVMTHQGGFPSNNVTKATWADHARMRAEVCDFALDWTPGSKLQYHGQAAHLVQAMVIEAVTGQDYRDVIREQGYRAARIWPATSSSAYRHSRSHVAPTPMRRSRAITLPNSVPRVCRVAAVSPRRAAWRRSIRCCLARDGLAMCVCSRRG